MKLNNYARFITLITVLYCSVNASLAQVMINEFSCSNISLTDNFGDTPDWVEIYNAGGSAANIGGYHLSDKKTNPTKWVIPATAPTVPPGGFLRIWISGKNTVVGANVHAGFKLTQTKPEALVFADAAGAIIDSMTLKPTQSAHSRGRTTNGAATWSVFISPTPGASNISPQQEYATKPSLSVAAGFYPGAQTVSISSPDAGVTIYFTTNGDKPTAGSTVYSAPVNISTTSVLRAIAISSNPLIPKSFVNSNTYFIGAGSTHTIPVVSVFGDQVDVLLGGTQLVAETGLEYYSDTKVLVAEVDGTTDEHGNDSWAYSQRGFDFIGKDEMGYNSGVNTQVFENKDRDEFQRLIFKAAANDNYPFAGGGAHIRDSYAHTLAQRADLKLDPRTWEPCIVYVNGQYWGVYDIREKVDDLDFTSHYYQQDDPYVQFLQTWGGTWTPYGGPAAQADWDALRNYITSNSMAVQANYDYVDSLFNVESFTDYFVYNSWLVSADWLNWNTSWWRGLDPAGNKRKWRYTLWDLDAILGHYANYTGIPDTSPNADPCNVDALPNPGGQGHTEILNALMANPGYKQFYTARYVDLMNTKLNCSFVLPLYDSMIAVIQPEMAGQIAKWGGSFSSWQANAASFRQDLVDRCAAMSQGMVDCYSLTGPYNITYDVSPAGAGTIKVNSINPPSYIWSSSYFGGMQTLLKAKPNGAYIFDHWDMPAHTPTPGSSSDSVAVSFTGPENVVAVFRLATEPPGGEAVGVPTAFSPNMDGNNDLLFVLGSVEKLDFAIYNRWGQQVFRTTDRAKGWDGTFNGQALNAGVFAYRLSGILPSGGNVEQKGNITLVR